MTQINPWIIGGGVGVAALLLLTRGGGGGDPTLASMQISSAQDTALGSQSIQATTAKEIALSQERSHQLDVLSQISQARMHEETARKQSTHDFIANLAQNEVQRHQADLVFSNQIVNGANMYAAMAKGAEVQAASQLAMAQVAAGAQKDTAKQQTKGDIAGAVGDVLSAIVSLFA